MIRTKGEDHGRKESGQKGNQESGKSLKKVVKKGGNKSVKQGDAYKCSVCGLVVSVDEVCGCVDTCDLICCEEPMKAKKRA